MRTNGLLGEIRNILILTNLARLYEFCITGFVCRKQCNELHSRIWLVLYRCKQKVSFMDGSKLLVQFSGKQQRPGPYAEETDVKDIQPGDIIQLSFGGAPHFDHSPVVVQVGSPASLRNILVAAHTYDRDYYPLTNYNWVNIRFIQYIGCEDTIIENTLILKRKVESRTVLTIF